LANLVLSEGHPSEVMDMSFGLQALMSEYIVQNKNNLKPGMVDIPTDCNPNQKSIKELKNIYKLLNLREILEKEDVNRDHFLKYTLECIYGGVHGIIIRDIIEFISDDSAFLNDVKRYLIKN